jgi:hypothetical protein
MLKTKACTPKRSATSPRDVDRAIRKHDRTSIRKLKRDLLVIEQLLVNEWPVYESAEAG